MTETNGKADKIEPNTDAGVEPTVESAKVEDLRAIEDRIITLAEPHLREGGVLARMYADRPDSQAVYDFVSTVKDVARMIQEEQRMKANPASAKRPLAEAKRLRAEMRRKAEASKRQR